MSLQNLAAERAVLSGFCQYGLDAYIDVESIVDISCFTDKTNQHLFRCIQHVLKDGSEVDVSSSDPAVADEYKVTSAAQDASTFIVTTPVS